MLINPLFWLTVPPSRPETAPLAEAAYAFGRLFQDHHPLLPAIRYRARLEAARRCAAVDGKVIDPWHLAALLAGLRVRLDAGESIADRGGVFAAARHALEVHGWLGAPDIDQEGDIQRAEAAPAATSADTPWQAAALAMRAWVEAGMPRMALRAALIRHWHRHRLLPAGVPVIGATSLAVGETWEAGQWVPGFYRVLAAAPCRGGGKPRTPLPWSICWPLLPCFQRRARRPR